MTEIEAIMNMKSHSKDILVSAQQSGYIKAFILIYMIYLKKIVSSKLLDVTGHNADIKIGYSITIENMLLRDLFGTKEGFEDVIYASGLLRKDDARKKLRVITQGEGILPVIQQCWKLQFPVKSFFVVAHLHEDYIQLNLNQVVAEEEDQEAFIIQDEIVRIPNVYTSLCLNMWNNIVEENSLVQMCGKHLNKELLEIFSVQNQICFTNNLARYLSNNILKTNSILQDNEKTVINISTSCSCRVFLAVNDIVEICFRPVIQDLISLVSSSLINRELFGKYRHIQYIFHLICFNYNPQFQSILIKILEDETDQFMYEQGMDIPHYIVPKLSNQLFQPVLRQRPLSYKGFQVGVLQHICSENYGYKEYFNRQRNSISDFKKRR
ncbi:hypothetical protein EDC94DRAFT_625549 [Helicostylum pulchrum]|nr:hypothetical protein EDC94DRAFT_625549 [Helicostylum pulchrum]